MSDYQIVVPGHVGFNGAGGAASVTSTATRYPIGFRALGYDTSLGVGEFIYCQQSNVVSRGQFVRIHNGSAVLLAAAHSASANQVGVIAAAFTGSSDTAMYGWVQVKGRADYARGTNSSIAAGVPLYICAGSVGYVLPDSVAGNRVQGLVCPVSYTSSQSASLTVDMNGACFVNGATAVL